MRGTAIESRALRNRFKVFDISASRMGCGCRAGVAKQIRNIHALLQAKVSEKAHGYCVECFFEAKAVAFSLCTAKEKPRRHFLASAACVARLPLES
jgi:hypothetical protein